MGFLDNTGLARLWEHINSLLGNRVPATRTINGKALSSDITLSASDVGALATSSKGAANGVAELDSTGKVPTAQLPAYVDDVLEYDALASFPSTGETGKIYVDTATNKTYRWSGSTYTEISSSLALGTTSSTAYRGDRGAEAYAHAVTNKGAAFASGLYKITTNSEGHVTAATAVAKSDITALGIPAQDTQVDYFTIEEIDEITGGCPLEPKVCYTLRIDTTNSNPLTACEYLDDATGMTKGASTWDEQPIFNAIKPCVFNNGAVAYYLNSENFNLKEDGSLAVLDGTDGDVMIEFSKFAYRLYKEGNYQYVSITNDPDLVASDDRFHYYAFTREAEGDIEKMYIGAFKGYMDANGKMRSIANGELPTASISLNQSKTAAALTGTNYSIFEYGQLVALQCLYLIKYGNLDCQAALGLGLVNATASVAVGFTLDKGMYYGSTTDGTIQMKFAGIEDLWGNIAEWCDGFVTGATDEYVVTYGNETQTFNTGLALTDYAVAGYLSKVQGTTELGFSGAEFAGSETTYYSDDSGFNPSGVLDFGASWVYGLHGGLFCLFAGFSADDFYPDVGARLTYV